MTALALSKQDIHQSCSTLLTTLNTLTSSKNASLTLLSDRSNLVALKAKHAQTLQQLSILEENNTQLTNVIENIEREELGYTIEANFLQDSINEKNYSIEKQQNTIQDVSDKINKKQTEAHVTPFNNA